MMMFMFNILSFECVASLLKTISFDCSQKLIKIARPPHYLHKKSQKVTLFTFETSVSRMITNDGLWHI